MLLKMHDEGGDKILNLLEETGFTHWYPEASRIEPQGVSRY